jgi:hypothetical protein
MLAEQGEDKHSFGIMSRFIPWLVRGLLIALAGVAVWIYLTDGAASLGIYTVIVVAVLLAIYILLDVI